MGWSPGSEVSLKRRRGLWDRCEAYFNEADRLDPRNAYLLTEHAYSYICLRRFPEVLRKLDKVLDIIADDVDTLAEKAGIAQAEDDLPRAAALLALLPTSAYARRLGSVGSDMRQHFASLMFLKMTPPARPPRPEYPRHHRFTASSRRSLTAPRLYARARETPPRNG